MFATLTRRPAARRNFRPEFDALEERTCMSVTAGSTNNVSYLLKDNGELWRHSGTNSNAGWRRLETADYGGGIADVSAGINADVNDAVFVRYKDHELWEYSDRDGWSFITCDAADISASLVDANDVYVVTTGGKLYEHTGLDSDHGWKLIESDNYGGGICDI